MFIDLKYFYTQLTFVKLVKKEKNKCNGWMQEKNIMFLLLSVNLFNLKQSQLSCRGSEFWQA